MSHNTLFHDAFSGRRVLVLGGLGFLGSSLAIRLADYGAVVTVADAMLVEYGGNLFNIAPIRDTTTVNYCDIRDAAAMNWLVRDKDYRNHGIRCVLSRLTNISGPRAQMHHNHFGMTNWFMRLAIDDTTIPLSGDGRIKRDFLYSDDRVDALLLLAVTPEAEGNVSNIGHDAPSDFLSLAETLACYRQNQEHYW